MLRTLGYQNKSLVVLLVIQAMFQSIPATLIGFFLLYILTQAAQIALFITLGISVAVKFQWSTIVLGLFTGIVIPMISNIYPIKQALGNSLRNALDRFRQGVDDVEVQFLKMENSGASPTQLSISIVLCLASILTLYFIPSSILDGSIRDCIFYLNLLLIGCVLGIVFIGQSAALYLCQKYTDLILVFVPSDRKLKPLIQKNLNSHSLKNLKANLLYSVTICFLVFQASNFHGFSNYLQQMLAAIFGGDISVKSIDQRGANPIIDEFRLRNMMEGLVTNDGLVSSFSINSATVKAQFMNREEAPIQEYLIGNGLRWSKGRIGNVES